MVLVLAVVQVLVDPVDPVVDHQNLMFQQEEQVILLQLVHLKEIQVEQ